MKMVATAAGEFAGTERSLLAIIQGIFGTDVDIDALQPITAEELAEHIVDPAYRRQIIRGMVVLSLVDGEASPAESALVKKCLGWVVRTLAAMAGLREDEGIAKRYRDLAKAPEGSLGRASVDFIDANGFSFPGEKGSPPETIALHDLTHVLSGYGTDPEGEPRALRDHAARVSVGRLLPHEHERDLHHLRLTGCRERPTPELLLDTLRDHGLVTRGAHVLDRSVRRDRDGRSDLRAR